jgi:hypothetical protein
VSDLKSKTRGVLVVAQDCLAARPLVPTRSRSGSGFLTGLSCPFFHPLRLDLKWFGSHGPLRSGRELRIPQQLLHGPRSSPWIEVYILNRSTDTPEIGPSVLCRHRVACIKAETHITIPTPSRRYGEYRARDRNVDGNSAIAPSESGINQRRLIRTWALTAHSKVSLLSKVFFFSASSASEECTGTVRRSSRVRYLQTVQVYVYAYLHLGLHAGKLHSSLGIPSSRHRNLSPDERRSSCRRVDAGRHRIGHKNTDQS